MLHLYQRICKSKADRYPTAVELINYLPHDTGVAFAHKKPSAVPQHTWKNAIDRAYFNIISESLGRTLHVFRKGKIQSEMINKIGYMISDLHYVFPFKVMKCSITYIIIPELCFPVNITAQFSQKLNSLAYTYRSSMQRQ